MLVSLNKLGGKKCINVLVMFSVVATLVMVRGSQIMTQKGNIEVVTEKCMDLPDLNKY